MLTYMSLSNQAPAVDRRITAAGLDGAAEISDGILEWDRRSSGT